MTTIDIRYHCQLWNGLVIWLSALFNLLNWFKITTPNHNSQSLCPMILILWQCWLPNVTARVLALFGSRLTEVLVSPIVALTRVDCHCRIIVMNWLQKIAIATFLNGIGQLTVHCALCRAKWFQKSWHFTPESFFTISIKSIQSTGPIHPLHLVHLFSLFDFPRFLSSFLPFLHD